MDGRGVDVEKDELRVIDEIPEDEEVARDIVFR